MRYSSQVKPISYLKANAAEVLARLAEHREPLVITQNGEAKAVLQDVASFEETQETLPLLKILALGNQNIEAGNVKPVAGVAGTSAGQARSRLMTAGPLGSATRHRGGQDEPPFGNLLASIRASYSNPSQGAMDCIERYELPDPQCRP